MIQIKYNWILKHGFSWKDLRKGCVCFRVYWFVTCVPAGAVQAGKLDVVLPGIGPVYTVIDEVKG